MVKHYWANTWEKIVSSTSRHYEIQIYTNGDVGGEKKRTMGTLISRNSWSHQQWQWQVAPAAPAELSAAPHFEGPEGPTHLAIFEDRLCWTRKTWAQRVAPSTWRRGAFVWRETLPLAQSCVRLLGVLEEAQLVGVPPQSPQHSNLIQSHPISTSQHLNIQ